MNDKQIIREFKDWLKREKRIDLNLDSLEEEILEYSLQGLSYSTISDRIMNYDLSYISNIKAPKLFRKLRQVTGLDINKKNCQLTIKKILTSGEPQVIEQITVNLSHINLREAPDFNDFYGRTIELAKLHQWIIKQDSRLVGIFGLTGIGKTALVRELVENIKDNFDHVIWKNLEFSPDWEQFINHLESCFGYHSSETSSFPRILNLIDYLKNHRCLLIFDQWGGVVGNTASSENYNNLLSQVGSLQHQSCVLFTALQKPAILDSTRNQKNVKQLLLSSLDNKDARILLENLGLQDPGMDTLIRTYKGHPLALILVSENIKNVHNGKIEKILDSTLFLHNVFMDLLDNQICSLPNLQQNMIKKLAAATEPQTIFQIYQYFPDSSQAEISDAINNLWKVGIIDKDDILEEIILWVLNPLIQKYIKKRYQ